MDDDRRLILFVKLPLPGRVKTRLAASLGAERAAEIYKAMAEDCLDIARSVPAPLTIAYDPPEAGLEIRAWLKADAAYEAQSPGDLGQRMAGAFENAFQAGAKRVLLMGSDVPDAPPEHLREAFHHLDSCDAVLAPCPDGGFWCVGFRAEAWWPEVFSRVPWSTEDTLAEVVTRLAGYGTEAGVISPWADVDTFSDLRALVVRLQGTRAVAQRTRILLPDDPHDSARFFIA